MIINTDFLESVSVEIVEELDCIIKWKPIRKPWEIKIYIYTNTNTFCLWLDEEIIFIGNYNEVVGRKVLELINEKKELLSKSK